MARIVGFFNFEYLDKVGCALFSIDGQLLKVNKIFSNWTGKKKKGTPIIEVFPEMHAERFTKGIEKRGRFNYKVTMPNKRGDDMDLQFAFRKVERNGVEYIFIQGNDRTREREKDVILKRATQLLEKRNRELDRLNHDLTDAYDQLVLTGKMTAVGELATSMILEMRHPLELMMVNAQLLDDHIRDPEATEMVQSITQSCAQVSKIVEGLRAFAEKKERGAQQPHELSRLLEDAVKLCRRQIAARKIKLDVAKVDDGCLIACYPTELSQVFLNVLNNASEAVSDFDDAWIRIEVEKGESDVAIRIIDSGEGLPEALASKLMEPFFTTKDAGAGRGTGLGLTISKKIVQSHRGSLVLDTDSENTCFVVKLPLAESENGAE